MIEHILNGACDKPTEKGLAFGCSLNATFQKENNHTRTGITKLSPERSLWRDSGSRCFN